MLGNKRRSFFLFIITVRNSPCNFKRNVDRSAEKREQQYDLFKRHDASPLPALKRPGRNEISKKKFALTRHSGTGKELAATEPTAACGRNREARLGQRPVRRECRPRHEADAGCRNPEDAEGISIVLHPGTPGGAPCSAQHLFFRLGELFQGGFPAQGGAFVRAAL